MEYITEADLIRYAWLSYAPPDECNPWFAWPVWPDAHRCAAALVDLNNFRYLRRNSSVSLMIKPKLSLAI